MAASTFLAAAIALLALATAVAVGVDRSAAEGGPHDVALEALVPLAVLLGLAACAWRLRSGGSWWWAVPAAAFLAGVAFPLYAWSDFTPPPDGDGCGNDGMLPESVRAFGWRVLRVPVPLLAVANLGVGAFLLARRGHRDIGAWCLLAAATLAVGWYANASFCV